ncbi:prolyl oligopeptidase family serine peptidase [Microbacterium betulae]|uniref:Prolyl oligopeptidase family serine peptidase n=1 Tax=Microbacterium betulae TaxID=2981139 RepID=A0AA97FI83_9MICO|nr:prolyl oligopeptidase family serine peptidase [Microbacterium sp. AB]WOF22012.1 prolyl oligopeptidase family serine peptidase [Microbacterium sp. AB]
MTQTLPYGSWPSPIAAADIARSSPRLGDARFVGDDIWWAEGVAAERGRTAVLRASDGESVLPSPWSARSRVHEYGGGAWTATDDGVLLFVEQSDQRVYALAPGGEPRALTPASGGMGFGDLVLADGRLWAVRETHDGSPVPPRDIVVVPLDGSAQDDASAVLSVVAGSDFVAYPAPRGDRLAWIAWDHPDMPWDATELRVGRIDASGRVAEWSVVAGGRGAAGGADVSALQPEWTGDGELLFVSDPPIGEAAGAPSRWNLSRATRGARGETSIAPVHVADADTGGALWNLGTRWYAPLEDGRIVAVETDGRSRLVLLDPASGAVAELETPLGEILVADVRGSRVLLVGAGPRTPGGIWLLDVDARTVEPVRGGVTDLDPRWLPEARAMSFTGPRGDVHTFAYPPTSPEARGPADELPPYLVLVHGGPTAHVSGSLSLAVTYFTSRGIGVLDVNYGGSTGYGRAYRERLKGGWGVVDVADAAAAAAGIAEAGLADRRRLAIRGGSAGGWTVLCAVAGTDAFAAGISRYGVADLRMLVAETHDFEARYLDGLVGPLPEAEELYVSRSPLSRPETLRTPLLILQGAEDPVVPPSQSEALRDALAANGVPHAYILFDGESHGFRGREAIVRSLEAEVAFLGAVLGFDAPGVPELALDGMSARGGTF